MVNWKEHGNPFLDFTEEITQEWIDKGFNKEQTKEWLNISLKVEDTDFVWWIKNIKKKNAEWVLNCGDKEELRKEYEDYLENKINDNREVNNSNWQDIHPDFTTKLQQEWKGSGFTYEQTKEWISAGLGVGDVKHACWLEDELGVTPEWALDKFPPINLSFLHDKSVSASSTSNDTNVSFLASSTSKKKQETNWGKGIRFRDSEFQEGDSNSDGEGGNKLFTASTNDSRETKFKLSTTLMRRLEHLENSLRKEKGFDEDYISAQRWLNENYPEKQRWFVKSLDLSNQNLADDLDLTDFTELEILDCHNNQLTSLNVNGLRKLRILSCFGNKKMVSLQLDHCSNITILDASNNNLLGGNLSIFSHLVNLEKISLIATDFSGSLEPLKYCLKLEGLIINKTNIDSGLEYLSNSVRIVSCINSKDSNPSNIHSQITKIERQLLPYYINTSVENKNDEYYFLRKEENAWKTWKKDNQKLIEQARGSSAQEWLNKNYPQERRASIKKLDISDKNFGGELVLNDFSKLEELYCGENKLIFLDANKCNNLRRLHCADNQLLELNLGSCYKLEYLHCSKNKLIDLQLPNKKSNLKQLIIHENKLEKDLSFLEEFTNLEELYAGGNLFYGSLKYLENLTKLRNLDISDNEINSDLEYLPSSIEEFHCYTCVNPQAKVKKIQEELQPFIIDVRKGKYDWKGWRKEKENGAQRWLNQKYPNKEQVEMIDLTDLKVDHLSELIIANYPKLKKIWKVHENKDIPKITKVDISNCPRLEKVDISQFVDNQKLNLSNVSNLKKLYCSNNKLTELNLLNCPQLEEVWCIGNQLIFLDLTNNFSLNHINCSHNFLTKIKLPLWGGKIEELYLGNNNFSPQDLSFLSHLVNLKELSLGNDDRWTIMQGIYNRFVGSLEPLQKMSELKELRIDNTDLNGGLEYLPDSVWIFRCSNDKRFRAKVGKFDEELFLYGRNLKAWKEAHPELMGEKWVNNNYEQPLKIIEDMPHFLIKEKTKVKENYHLKEINYQEIILRDKRPFSWEINQFELLSSKNLPIKLYKIKTGKVEWTQSNPSIKSYATLSYVWGSMKDKTLLEEMKVTYQKGNEEYEEELVITKWGRKSLTKAIKACEYLGIDYLWIDQLCINQKDREEKGEEVRKMRKCYGDSTVTLISINTEAKDKETNVEDKKEFAIKTLKKIINSQWFTRSWTYQEGLLSKQTIFMFDDCLIDGRMMAQVWAMLEKEDHLIVKDYQISNEDPEQFITPVGWTHGKKKDNCQNQINLGLSQALVAIKNRGRNNPIDGIYSILGLLPYGEQVKPKYKERGHQCTKEELEEALMDVMKEAIKNGYAEPLAWFGPRRNEPGLWWIPKIDEKGSVVSQGKAENINFEPEIIEFTENGVKLTGHQYVVDYLDTDKMDSCDLEYGEDSKYLNSDVIRIITTDNSSFSLPEDWEVLEKIKPGDILVIPDDNQWKIKDDDFYHLAILIPKKDKFIRPINIIKLWRETAQNLMKKELFIDMVNKRVKKVIEEKQISQQNAQIQIPPK